MPNHIHAIFFINENVGVYGHTPDVPKNNFENDREHRRAPLQRESGSLGSIVAGYKSAVTARVNRLRKTAGRSLWQRNYYDHVIRSERELENIRAYITHNVLLAEKIPSEVLTWQKN